MHRNLAFVAAVTTGVTLVACATSPTGRKQLILLPEEQMATLGAQAFDQLKTEEPVSNDPAFNAYVGCISNAILDASGLNRGQSWEIVVFDSDQVNAFALPGAKIGVYTGMIRFAENQDQLAAVIGHEIGHVIARHSNERVSEQQAAALAQGGFALLLEGFQTDPNARNAIMAGLGLGHQFGRTLPHSRTQETEADVIGLDLMAQGGFAPSAAPALWDKMAARGESPPEFMSTHPSPDRRANELRERVPSVQDKYDAARAAGRRPSCTRPTFSGS